MVGIDINQNHREEVISEWTIRDDELGHLD